MIWEFLLITSVAGMFVIILRKFPNIVETIKELQPEASPPTPPAVTLKKEDSASKPASVLKKEAPIQEPPPVSMPIEADGSPEAAENAFRAREFARAAELYARLIEESPRNSKFYNRIGMCYLETESFIDARDAFRMALKLDETVASHHANLGMSEYALGHRLTAVRHLRRAIAIDPDKERYHELLASLERERD